MAPACLSRATVLLYPTANLANSPTTLSDASSAPFPTTYLLTVHVFKDLQSYANTHPLPTPTTASTNAALSPTHPQPSSPPH